MRSSSAIALLLAGVAVAAPPAAPKTTSTVYVTKTATQTVKTSVTVTATAKKTATVTSTVYFPSYVTTTSTATSTVHDTITQTQPAQTITQTSTQTQVLTSTLTSTVTSTETDVSTTTATATATATETDVSTITTTETDQLPPATITSTITQSAATVTLPASSVTLPASTVTLPASTVTLPASVSTLTLPASTVTSVSTLTVGSTGSSSVVSSTSSVSSSIGFNSTTTTSGSSSTVSSSNSSSTSASSSAVITSSATTTTNTIVNYPQSTQWTATSKSAVAAAAATALTNSPTSNVAGKSFNRFVMIWLENTDYSLASTDPNLQMLAAQGITLTNYFGVTHPSQPNYVASHAGDYFGMDNDNFNFVNANVSTVFDLLDTKGISWGEYQESMPYSGYEGKAFVNQTTGANNYVRKHNPGVIFNSNSESTQRLSQMKNLSMFYTDLANQQLPQWMFITPNELNDGHDTGVTYAGNFMANFLGPLLNNSYFMEDTLILVTFDETETYSKSNNVYSFLLGGVVPQSLVGTVDSNYYNHYSQISTVSANWDLPTLGRWDVGANVYSVVAASTGDSVRNWTAADGLPTFDKMYFNTSYSGPFNSARTAPGYAVPNINAVSPAGRTVLSSVASAWAGYNGTYYTSDLEVNDGMHAPAGWCTSGLC